MYSSKVPDEDFKRGILDQLKITLNSPYGEGNSVYQRFSKLLIDSYPDVAAMKLGDRSTMTASLYNNILLSFLTGVKNYDFEKDSRNFRRTPSYQDDFLRRWLRADMNQLHAILQIELPRWFAYFASNGAQPKYELKMKPEKK
jgi:hypothetical protein